MSETLERILEEVKTLSAEERRQLIALLDGTRNPGALSSAEREFEQKLAAEGWLSVPSLPPGDLPLPVAPPYPVSGPPLSEILIEGRMKDEG